MLRLEDIAYTLKLTSLKRQKARGRNQGSRAKKIAVAVILKTHIQIRYLYKAEYAFFPMLSYFFLYLE